MSAERAPGGGERCAVPPSVSVGPRRGLLARALVMALVVATPACSWFTDFKDQPKVEPWESVADSIPPRGNPQNSVPLYGTAVPGFVVSRQAMPATIDSMAALSNPVAADARSLENGRKLYQINCAVCHAANGSGAGPAVRYGMVGITLVSDRVRGLSDGYIWGMMRNGRGLMPSYNRIEELERWDVVNYIRGLQGRYVVDTTMARPGITGNALPTATMSAPTLPVPFVGPVRTPTAGSTTAPSHGGTADSAMLAPTDTSAGRGRRP